MQLAIDLPEDAFERLSRLAELTNQPLSKLVVQSINGNLPPSVETASIQMQPELLELQTEPVDKLRQIALSQIPPEQQQRLIALLELNQDGPLNDCEKQELHQLSPIADRLMLKKAHAFAILRWRGQPSRDLTQLLPS